MSDRASCCIKNLPAEHSKTLAHALLESVEDGILLIHPSGKIATINQSVEVLFGVKRETIIGTKIQSLLSASDNKYFESELQNFSTTHNFRGARFNSGCEVAGIRGDGTEIFILLWLRAISFHGKQWFACTIRDVSQNKSRETQVKQLSDHQTRLYHLERLSKLGEMTAGIAHEIDQPLTAISTYAQSALRFLATDTPKLERAKAALMNLSDEARRAGSVIEGIRELARQQPVDYQPIDCNLLIDGLKELTQSDARSQGITICTELHPDLPSVLGDPIQLQQVVLNLIRNAIDATKDRTDYGKKKTGESGPEVTICTSIAGRGDVCVSVIDAGTGVDTLIAKDIFRPFSSSKNSGMGLGLSISRSIISAHGGQLNFQNNSLGGATFFFTLQPAQKELQHE